ncbi:MAG: PKD domain-containing protein [Kocuria sp.]|nr:PKD domain-containing protein [Kocuria sp.]
MDTVSSDGEGYLTSERVRVDTQADSEELLGFDCTARGGGGGPAEGSEPVVITITRSDFESMEVEPLVASAGPEDGWLPVNMVNVLYAKSESQTLATEVLGVPVSVRAVPVSYHWDLGDGNTITTTNAGEPFPSEAVSGTYRYEGWYDVTLTTTFSGQFSVAGGPWQDIDGTIEVASDPIPVYSKSLESRLVDGDVPVDENEDPWVPERTAETEGPQDPAATHRET